MNALQVHVVVPLSTLAAQVGPDPKDVKQGWLGFGVFLALAVAVVLLWLSFRRQLKKVDFVEEPAAPGSRPRRPVRVTIPTTDDAATTRPQAEPVSSTGPDSDPDSDPDSGPGSQSGSEPEGQPGSRD